MDAMNNPKAIKQFTSGSNIYNEGEKVTSIAMIVKGRVLIHNDGLKLTVSPGTFLGINDLYKGKYLCNYTAYDDVMIYKYTVRNTDEFEHILTSNKEYHGFMVASFYNIIFELDRIYQGITKYGSDLYDFLNNCYKSYLDFTDKAGFQLKTSDKLSQLTMFDNDLELLRDKIDYYKECRSLPIDTVKAFYSYGDLITAYQLEEQVDISNQLIESVQGLSEHLISMAECMVDGSDNCMIQLIAYLADEIGKTNINGDFLMDIMDSVIEEINKIENFIENNLGRKFNVNRAIMEEVYHKLLTGENGENKDKDTKTKQDNSVEILMETEHSFDKILEYAGIEEERAAEMKKVMDGFVKLKDKSSSEDEPRRLRSQLSKNHYELYEKVFLKAYQDEKVNHIEIPKIIDLFLNYGFADERLLSREKIIAIYSINTEKTQTCCNIYTIKEWLTSVYEGNKAPSKNEFDQEYSEMVYSMKKQGEIKENEVKEWMEDPGKKLNYEIQNMFRYNNRLTNGQITSFVPVLHEDIMSGNIERTFVTPQRLEEAIQKLMSVDYSVFDRELLYIDHEKNIAKEYIIKRVYPDIILMPTEGVNGVMWQEISCRRRDSAGRFLLPIFADIELTAILVKVLGRYRWELCRTIEGTAWNDIKHKSLTSEYCDYLQFYRKNKDLSEERKEKLKQQIQKGRGNSREIFAIDYENWVMYEAIGALKLNRPTRAIMATYVPFAKEIREKFRNQPVFEEAMGRYYRQKIKKIHEIEGRYRLLQKDKIELTQELVDTLAYYKEL